MSFNEPTDYWNDVHTYIHHASTYSQMVNNKIKTKQNVKGHPYNKCVFVSRFHSVLITGSRRRLNYTQNIEL